MLNPGRWVIFVDSNVWYSRTLRERLGMLYVTPEAPPFHVQWTDDVLAELLYHLRKLMAWVKSHDSDYVEGSSARN